MELIRWNPNRQFSGLNDRFGSVLDSFFYPSTPNEDVAAHGKWNPVVDIYEDEGSYVITAEVPGVEKKDIGIDVKDRVLTLHGERTADSGVSEDSFYRRERCHGRFERIFTLPLDVDPDKIDAAFKDGVLTITIPKPEERKPKMITVH